MKYLYTTIKYKYTTDELAMLMRMLIEAHDLITSPERPLQRAKRFYRELISIISDMNVPLDIPQHLTNLRKEIFVEPYPPKKKNITYQETYDIWYGTPLNKMPLYINNLYFKVIAQWRLKIGK